MVIDGIVSQRERERERECVQLTIVKLVYRERESVCVSVDACGGQEWLMEVFMRKRLRKDEILIGGTHLPPN